MVTENSKGTSLYPTNAIAVGNMAFQTLQTETKAKICGHSSKGIFAVTDSKRILFITDQKYRGPLTINISGKLPLRTNSNDELPLEISPSRINCPRSGFVIDLNSHTFIWHSTLTTALKTNLNILWNRSELLEEQIKDKLFNKTSIFTTSNNQAGLIQSNLPGNHSGLSNELTAALASKNKTTIYKSLAKFLGYGAGLTPSGDDFICGFLLAAYLWQEQLYPHLNLPKIVQNIVAVSFENTTTLSANLISCAAIGSADERIINCMVWLSGKEASIEFFLEELLSYGNSSGIDTLAGVQTFVQSSAALKNRL